MTGEQCADLLSELSLVDPDPPSMRTMCENCRRPTTVCWCSFLPAERLSVNTKVYILQHPYEETRSLRTAVMLTAGLREGQCVTLKGKRFSAKKFSTLRSIVEESNTLLLYPGPNAVDLDSFAAEQRSAGLNVSYNLVVLDGTWLQARGLYWQNAFLHSIKQVQLSNTGPSEYVVRTQPTNACLSTLETVAISIGILEDRPDVYPQLIRPLHALCDYQLKHGAVRHQSKQYLKEHGLYVKQVNPHGLTSNKRRRKRNRRGGGATSSSLSLDTAEKCSVLTSSHILAEKLMENLIETF